MDREYKPKYGDRCECPYCGEAQDVDVSLDSDVYDEEIDCEDCGGKFTYNLEVTIDFACHPIEGEGPRGDDGELIAGPKFIDPNQINLLEMI